MELLPLRRWWNPHRTFDLDQPGRYLRRLVPDRRRTAWSSSISALVRPAGTSEHPGVGPRRTFTLRHTYSAHGPDRSTPAQVSEGDCHMWSEQTARGSFC
jgi:hypothetical protein